MEILETIYDFLLHTFALIGLVLTLVIILVMKVLHEESQREYDYNEDEILATKTDRELYDEEN